MSKGTTLVCPVCDCTDFIKKGNKGNMLVACKECGHSARVSKAGIISAEISKFDNNTKVFPIKRNKSKSTKKKKVFHEISFRVPLPIKRLIQASLFCAKADGEITGKWYAGASLGNIMADYLAGFNFDVLDEPTFDRVQKLLGEVEQSITDEEEKEKNFGDIPQEEYKQLSIDQASSILKFKDEKDEEDED